MPGISSIEIQNDFIIELKSYIPALTEMVDKLETQVGGDKELTELHRLVHTIKGASSLVKLKALSSVAGELEDMIEAVIHKRLDMSGDVFAAIRSAAAYFDGFTLGGKNHAAGDDGETNAVMASLQRIRSDKRTEADRRIGSGGAVSLAGNIPAPELSPADIVIPGAEDPCVSSVLDMNFLDDGSQCLDDWDLESQYGDGPAQGLENDSVVELPQAELREGFYQEAEEHFQALGDALSALEAQITAPALLTAEHKELLRLIRRSVHTVKGAAAVIKLSDIANWGHAFEDLLDWLYEEAEQIDPHTLGVVAEAADMLERHVTAPVTVNQKKLEELRRSFAALIGTDASAADDSDEAEAGRRSIYVFDQAPAFDPSADHGLTERTENTAQGPHSLAAGTSRTVRVEMTRIENLSNLAGELIISLSAFDENMTGLHSVVEELDRSRQRLKSTARDLEVGYEVKAIQRSGSQAGKAPAATTPADERTDDFDDFDLLELDRYSEFNLLIRSLNETSVDVSTISTQLSDMHSGFAAYLNRLRILLSELQDKVMRVCMTPMTTILYRLRQTVRETAGVLGKNVRLTVSGEQIELDKRVWEKLTDPLMHLLRNAVDHGIESPAQREAAGKPNPATIRISAAYQGNQVIIRVTDDGAGLDYAAIRQRAGVLQPAGLVEEMSEADLAELIFLQGFSTRKQVSPVSGRGVGLDVVRENIASMKGSVQIEQSARGKGTSFIIRIPLTLAAMRALLFNVGGRLYATAQYDIREMLRVHPRDVIDDGGKSVQIGGRRLPLYFLSKVLFPEHSAAPAADAPQHLLVLVVDTGAWQGAVVIDRMHSQREIVIKNLGSHLRQVKGVAGATVMGDGSVVPILDLEDLLSAAPVLRQPAGTQREKDRRKALDIMVVDDSVSVRMVVSRLMQRQGWRVQTANDGVDAIEKLRHQKPDLILLDVEMPRMNGYEFMRAFHSQQNLQGIPVVMLTSRSAKKHRDKARSLGVNGYVVKPYEDEALIDMIRQMVAKG